MLKFQDSITYEMWHWKNESWADMFNFGYNEYIDGTIIGWIPAPELPQKPLPRSMTPAAPESALPAIAALQPTVTMSIPAACNVTTPAATVAVVGSTMLRR